ncbi:MAG: response regulator transcription factor [Rhodospirillaceae bacterium]|nr:response regulator transcription factor [Rhodospirillaceae bacterium]
MRILFADDHQLVRQTLALTLKRLNLGEEVNVDEIDALPALLALAGSDPVPRLILMDLSMPGMTGVADIEKVHTAFRGVPIVVVSGYADRETILASFKHGAAGFVPKATSRDEFLAAVKLVLQGQRFVPAQIVDDQITAPPLFVPSERPSPQHTNDSGAGATLSDRDRELLALLAGGKTNKEIARLFGIEEVTVKLALRRLYKKIGATNRASAVHIGSQKGMF